MWHWKPVQHDLVRYRNGHKLSEAGVSALDEIIASQVSKWAKGLPRDVTHQHLWAYFLTKVLPKLKTKKLISRHGKRRWAPVNWHAYICVALRREIRVLLDRHTRSKREVQFADGCGDVPPT